MNAQFLDMLPVMKQWLVFDVKNKQYQMQASPQTDFQERVVVMRCTLRVEDEVIFSV